jgi:mono/diheme cytochrome c family protein
LALHPTEYTEAEMFWIVKHGIRNTGMPAWGKLLSDEDISQVVAMVRRLDSPPPAAEAALREHANE